MPLTVKLKQAGPPAGPPVTPHPQAMPPARVALFSRHSAASRLLGPVSAYNCARARALPTKRLAYSNVTMNYFLGQIYFFLTPYKVFLLRKSNKKVKILLIFLYLIKLIS